MFSQVTDMSFQLAQGQFKGRPLLPFACLYIKVNKHITYKLGPILKEFLNNLIIMDTLCSLIPHFVLIIPRMVFLFSLPVLGFH